MSPVPISSITPFLGLLKPLVRDLKVDVAGYPFPLGGEIVELLDALADGQLSPKEARHLAFFTIMNASHLLERDVVIANRSFNFTPFIKNLAEEVADDDLSMDDIQSLVPPLLTVILASKTVPKTPAGQPIVIPIGNPPGVTVGPTPTPTQPSNPVPTPTNPQSGGGKLQTLTKLQSGIIFGERANTGGAGRFNPATEASGVGDRIHFDCTPTPDNPDELEQMVGADGNPKKPWVEPRWGTCNEDGSNEKLMWNSKDLPDAFELQSWEKKNESDTSAPGFTPVLQQEVEIGPGRHKCFMYFVISAEHNNGHAIDGSDRTASPRTYYYAS